MLLPYDGREEVKDFEDIHIFCVQGHPEFVTGITERIIDAREQVGMLDDPTVREARHRAIQEDDGLDAIARAIWKILGVVY